MRVKTSWMRLPTERRRIVAFFAAACLFLASVEYAIPKPVPFMRLGLANLPVLLSLEVLGPLSVMLLALLKVCGQGLIRGSLFSHVFLLSLLGSTSSTAAMLVMRRMFGRRVSLVGISVMGALVNNLVQTALARYLIFGKRAWLIAPPLLLVGTITSLALGLFAQRFARRSTWLKRLTAQLDGLPENACQS